MSLALIRIKIIILTKPKIREIQYGKSAKLSSCRQFKNYSHVVTTTHNVQTKTEGAISSGDWKLDPTELKEIFTSKTKAIIFNNPNNPLGKVIFSPFII